MFPEYKRALFYSSLVCSVLVAWAATIAGIPASLAAPIGSFCGLKFVQTNDVISKHFKTDADRIFEPSEEQKNYMVPLVVFSLAASSGTGIVFGAGYGAVIGILALVWAVWRVFFK